MADGKRKENKYESISIYLDISSKVDMEIYQLLRSSPRGKSKFIVALITHYLEERGIQNLHRLSTEEKRELVENFRLSPTATASPIIQPTSSDILQTLGMLFASYQSPQITKSVKSDEVETAVPEKKSYIQKKKDMQKADNKIIKENHQEGDYSESTEDNLSLEENEDSVMDNWKEALDIFN